MNEVICAPQVQVGEYAGSTEFLKGSRDQGKWVWQLHSLGIESTVVDARPQAPILLVHEEAGGRR